MENSSRWKRMYTPILDTIQTVLLAASVFIVIYLFLFRPFQVSGMSMHPTFKNGEYILTSIIGLRLADPKRGDVIVFKAPTDNEKDFIKRVIGLPGDTVMLQDGRVLVNGKLLDESAYLHNVMTFGGSFLKEGESITVPSGEYFVMGDNRTNSSDSREWGFVPKKSIIGKSFVVYWPVSEAEVVHNPYKN